MNNFLALPGRLAATAACVLMLLGVPSLVHAQSAWPAKPIRFISPNAAGGANSVIGQLIGQKLTEAWGQNTFVENRPGGNTVIGTSVVAKAAPDGYTFLAMSSSHLVVPLLMSAPYDAIADFTPVATVSSSEQLLIAHPSLPANTLAEVLALARAKPGALNYASSGGGSVTNLAAELFKLTTDVKIQHIPYKGGGPALTDLMGGQVQLMWITPPAAAPHLRSGKLKAIAVSGNKRLAAAPQVPTFAESGVADYDAKIWFGFLAPPKMPKAIVDKMSAEVARILTLPDVRDKLTGMGMEPLVSTPEQFLALMQADSARYARVIKAANIKLDD